MPTATSRAATAVVNGTIYVLGGTTNEGPSAAVEAYDPFSDSWQTKPSLAEARFAGADALQGGTIYIAGGITSGPNPTGSVLSYDTAIGTGSSIGTLVTSRMRASAAIMNNKIYVVGGSDNVSTVFDTIEEFDLSSHASVIKKSLPAPVQYAAVVASQGAIYIIGGLGSDGLPLNSNLQYDPVANSFTAKSAVPIPVGSRATVAADGKIYLIGGITNFNTMTWTDDIQVYDPQTDSWQNLGSFPTSRYAQAAGIMNNSLFVIGGSNGAGTVTGNLVTNESAAIGVSTGPAPVVTGYQPANGALVPVTSTVQATFSESMNPAAFSTNAFTVSRFIGAKAISARSYRNVVLKNDGTVGEWGDNGYGYDTVPAGLTGITAVTAGEHHGVALKNDGTVVAWGDNGSGQTAVPAGLSGVVAIAAGGYHTVALKSDGTVVAWGANGYGQTTVPAGLTGVAAIAAGYIHTVALKSDGTVVAWGHNQYGQTTVPAGLTAVAAIAAGNFHTVALKSDGTVVAWGYDSFGETTVPADLSDVAAIAAGYNHTVVLKSDGSVVAWGYNYNGQTTVPAGLSGVTAIAAGNYHTVAMKGDGTVAAWGSNTYGQITVPADLDVFYPPVVGEFGFDAAHLTATFTPAAPLVAGDIYHVTINGVSSQSGAPLAAPVRWSFATIGSKISTSPSLYDFGSAYINSSSGATFTISNYGTSPLEIGSITITGSDAGFFSVTPGSCANLTPAVAAGGSCTVYISFVPTASGSRSAVLQIVSNAANSPALSLPLNGFGVNLTLPLNINFSGSGSGTVNVQPTPPGISCSSNCNQYFNNGTVVSLTPAATSGNFFAGWESYTITYPGDGFDPPEPPLIVGCDQVVGDVCTVTMYGSKFVSAKFLPVVSIAPQTQDFGNVSTGSSSTMQTFTISNQSASPQAISSITLGGTDAAAFSVMPLTCSSLTPTLAAGGSCTIGASFNPAVAGSRSAVLQIAFNGSSLPVNVPLNGNGVLGLAINFAGSGTGTVNFSTTGPAGSCSNNCTQSFDPGTVVSLTPVAGSGSTFTAWSGCDQVTGNICQVTFMGSRTVTAIFISPPAATSVQMGPFGAAVTAVAVSPNYPADPAIFAISNGILYKSSDNGANWNTATTGMTGRWHIFPPEIPAPSYQDPVTVNTVAFSPNYSTDQTVFAGTNNGFYKSTNGGLHWYETSFLTAKTVNYLAISPGFATDRIIFCEADGELFKSLDGGANWIQIYLKSINGILTSLVLSPTFVSDHVLFAGMDASTTSGTLWGGGVIKSTNGGGTTNGGAAWSPINSGLDSLVVKGMTISTNFANDHTVFAETNSGIYLSTNGGTNWSAMTTSAPDQNARILAISPAYASDRTIFGLFYGALHRSTDAGVTWYMIDAVPQIVSGVVSPAYGSDWTLLAGATSGGIFKLTFPQPAPIISVMPVSLNLGPVDKNIAPSTRVVSIVNAGTMPLTVNSITRAGADSADFAVTPGSCGNLTPVIPSGGVCTINVGFSPVSTGSKNATLQIASNDPTTPVTSVPLTGLGVVFPAVTSASPPGGTYSTVQAVTLSANKPAVIYFTLDGTTPTTASAVYAGPIGISANATLKFFAKGTEGSPEPVKTENYIISLTKPLTVTVAGCGTVNYTTGDICTGTCNQSYANNTAITLMPAACAGSYLADWSGCDQISGNQCLVTMNAAKNVTATFSVGSNSETGTWTTVAAMTTSRDYNSATLLANGKVLVAGGLNWQVSTNGFGTIASAELYDPATNSWSSAGSMAMARDFHTAVLLPNGKVLVVGGSDGDLPMASAELYDPTSNSWSSAGSMANYRTFNTVTLLPNGKVLVTGGAYGGNSAELYDPASNSWSSAGSMSTARARHTATLLPNGTVLVAGGEAGMTDLSSAELYDPASNSWRLTGAMASLRKWHAATLLTNGKVLVSGGQYGYPSPVGVLKAELYDPTTQNWDSTNSMIATSNTNATVLLNNGNVLAISGSSELFDPASKSWRSAGSMIVPRGAPSATLLPNGKVLVSGGGSVVTELYTPAFDTVQPVTITSPPEGTYATAKAVTLTASKPATIYYTLDGTEPTTDSAVYGAPITISVSTVLKFFAKDSGGNTEPVKSAHYVIAMPLKITLTGDGAGSIHASPSAGISCFSGVCNNFYPPGTIVTLSATPAFGSVFSGWSGDCSGSDQCQVTMDAGKMVTAIFKPSGDTMPPTVTGFTMPATATALNVPVTSFTASDNVAVTGYLITESPFPPSANAAGWSSSPPSSYTFLAPGNCYAYAWAKDASGNVSVGSVAIVNITLDGSTDTVAPLITSFALQATNNLVVPITSLAVTDNIGVTGYLVSENSTTPLANDPRWLGNPPASYTFSNYGARTLYAWAKDGAGNVSVRVMATGTIMDPAQLLDTVLTGWPANPMTFSPSTFAFISNRDGVTFECNLDDQGYFPCASPISFGALANGSHTFSVRAKDVGGNYDETPANFAWTVYVPIIRINLSLYTTLATAYSSSSNGNVLEIKGLEFSENLTFDRAIAITLKGGHDAGFLAATGNTTIHGTVTITAGTVIMDNIIISQ